MHTRLLDRETVEATASVEAVIAAVESAFAAYARGDAIMPAKSYIDLRRYNGDFRSMPAYLDAGDWDAAGIKWVNVHPDNPDRFDLPTVMATVVYSDPETAYPLAIMDGTSVTLLRTGAAAAVATDHLAVEGATSLGIVGAGVQADAQLRAIAAVRPIETVVVNDVDEVAAEAFADRFADRFDVRVGTVAEAAGCDVLSTVTPVRSPVVDRADVGEHTHINAMGADAEGKQELDPAILEDAYLAIDDHEQCTHSGEINVPYAAGRITDDDIDAELGDVVIGAVEGRTDAVGVTVFDSTGLAIQDIATARIVYESAEAAGDGEAIDLLGV
ncbi:MAG: ornithine cyclodeaminase family protein [Halobacteriales archaeon]